MRMALLLPFVLSPIGLVLMFIGLLGLPSLLSLGYMLAWSGIFAAAPGAMYIVLAWLVIRPRTDRQLIGILVVAPPICGAISEVLEGYAATGSFIPREGSEYFFFRAATTLGYVAVAIILLVYAIRRRSMSRPALR